MVLATYAQEILAAGIAGILERLQDQGLGGSDMATVPTDALVVDARRFQFRIVSHHGTLKEVASWNPDLCGVLSVWRDPADGVVCVIDGHHRHGLALRLGVWVWGPKFGYDLMMHWDYRACRRSKRCS